MAGAAADYVVGPQDVLAIALWDWPEASGRYPVETDGTFTFPMIGRISAGGVRLRDVEGDLKRRLAVGYFENAQLSVTVAQYRSQRIVILGEVRSPGSYPLTGGMTLLEALAQAGSVTADAGRDAVIVRSGGSQQAAGAVPPGHAGGADVLQVDLEKLESRSLARNIALQDGDAIFVARAGPMRVLVFGQVRSPGAYPIQKGTSVVQALSLAGGVTDRGSTDRVTIVRWVEGRKLERKAKLDDPVHPGDAVVVAERFF